MRLLDDHLVRILHEAVLRHREDAPHFKTWGSPNFIWIFYFSFGEFDQDDQGWFQKDFWLVLTFWFVTSNQNTFWKPLKEKLLEKFGNKVEEVYNTVIGENDANISTLQMLTSVSDES